MDTATTEDLPQTEQTLDDAVVRTYADSILREFDTPNARTGHKEKVAKGEDGWWRTIYSKDDHHDEEVLIVSRSQTGAIWDEQSTIKIVKGQPTISYKSESVFTSDPQNPLVKRPLENTDSTIKYVEDQLARSRQVAQSSMSPTAPLVPSQPSAN